MDVSGHESGRQTRLTRVPRNRLITPLATHTNPPSSTAAAFCVPITLNPRVHVFCDQ